MDKSSLEEKKSSLQQQFEALNGTNQKLNQQMTDNNQELLKLAGEFRLVEELLNNWKEPVIEAKVKEKKNG